MPTHATGMTSLNKSLIYFSSNRQASSKKAQKAKKPSLHRPIYYQWVPRKSTIQIISLTCTSIYSPTSPPSIKTENKTYRFLLTFSPHTPIAFCLSRSKSTISNLQPIKDPIRVFPSQPCRTRTARIARGRRSWWWITPPETRSAPSAAWFWSLTPSTRPPSGVPSPTSLPTAIRTVSVAPPTRF